MAKGCKNYTWQYSKTWSYKNNFYNSNFTCDQDSVRNNWWQWLLWNKTHLQECRVGSQWKLLFLAIITPEECRPTIVVFQTWAVAFFHWHLCSKIRSASPHHILHSTDVIKSCIFFPTSMKDCLENQRFDNGGRKRELWGNERQMMSNTNWLNHCVHHSIYTESEIA